MYRYFPSWLTASAHGPPPVPKGEPGTCAKLPVTASIANTETFLPLTFGTKRNLPAGSMAAANGLSWLAGKGEPATGVRLPVVVSSLKPEILALLTLVAYTRFPAGWIASAVGLWPPANPDSVSAPLDGSRRYVSTAEPVATSRRFAVG